MEALNVPLLIFSLVFCVYIIGASFISYHLYYFGIGKAPKIILFVFLIGSVILLGVSVLAYNQVPWDSININFLPNVSI